MAKRKFEYYSADFETTVFEGQTKTEVWASALVRFYTEDVHIFHSIDETFEFLKDTIKSVNTNLCLYYHNLKFDGAFWLDFLINKVHLQQAYTEDENNVCAWLDEKEMPNNSFKYTISDRGQWYLITIKLFDKIIEIRDSLKLLPFSVRKIGEDFKTKHHKLNMEYDGERYAGCEITDSEKEYIMNDVLVVKEALEIMFNEGHNKLTIGACCMSEYKNIVGKHDYKSWFPALEEILLNTNRYKYENADKYIRKSYRGGWCYLVKGKENQVKKQGCTLDVNSLYPSMMSRESGNVYPVGKPHFWHGNMIPDVAKEDGNYFFIRIKTRFRIKEGFLPFIQIKSSFNYKGTEMLESSDVYIKSKGQYFSEYYDEDGIKHDTRVELTLTKTDFILLNEHYDLFEFEILDGCWFYGMVGLFDDYIEKYKKMKLENKGALRQIAKLFLNNLYGKMASNQDSSFKIAFNKDGVIEYRSIPEANKKAGFIAVGSAITSYARNFTIRTAQKNFYGKDKPGFIYADTDSIHCDLKPEQIKGAPVHDKNFCCWKVESCWDFGLFVRQKTYVEHVTHEDLQPIEKPYYNVKCAGMPERCKNLFLLSMQEITPDEENGLNKLTDEEKEFIRKKRKITDFKVGLKVPSKLMPKRIEGGIILVPTTYEMR